jgi:peroxiredoxin (alkyl hydroperoxide reductase subunit C)
LAVRAFVPNACPMRTQHHAWTETAREAGGLGKVKIPLVADLTREISKAYGVLLPHAGHSLRGLFIIDPEGVLRQITMNQPPVGR